MALDSRFRMLPNGDLILIRRGNIEDVPCPPGFVRDDYDKYLFHPRLKSCGCRTTKELSRSCCDDPITVHWCNKFAGRLELRTCVYCSEGGLLIDE